MPSRKTYRVEAITAYRSSDGTVFETPEEAGAHEAEYQRKRQVREWTEAHCYSGMVREDVAQAILENAESLLEALE